jgi:hypothetical protein
LTGSFRWTFVYLEQNKHILITVFWWTLISW